LSEKKFNDAIRGCWAVLRRQIALGLAAETRETKAFYARCVLSSIEEDNSRSSDRDFELAVRLLIEGGDRSKAQHIVWSRLVVRRFVRQKIISRTIDIAERFLGTTEERQRVVIELFRSWLLEISLDQSATASEMLTYIVARAQRGGVSSLISRDVGGRALAILTEIAQVRPELRELSVDSVFELLQVKLTSSGNWRSEQRALELAVEYQDMLSASQNRIIAENTLAILASLNPAQNLWPVSRPAMRVLTSRSAARMAVQYPGLSKTIIQGVIKYGAEQDSDAATTLFDLRNFNSAALRDPEIVAALQPAVSRLRTHIKTPTSTASVETIQALLLSPALSQSDGIKDALAALRFILSSPMKKQRSLSLAYAYAPLQMLVGRQEEFAEVLQISSAEVDRLWRDVLDDLLALWRYSATNPLVFAPFSLPEATTPSSTVVHNWASVSIDFGKSLGEEQTVQSALDEAAGNEQLRTSIISARAFGTQLTREADLSLHNLQGESADVFYSALGFRLSALPSLEEEERRNAITVLLQECLRHGPRELDLAVLIYAREHRVSIKPDTNIISHYIKKAELNRDTRLALMPLISKLKLDIEQSE
jgi:hypothetical protein